MGKRLNTLLVICTLLLVIINLFVAAKLSADVGRLQSQKQRSLPCAAIPTRFVVDEPECANKLLISMNVTNVHVGRYGSSDFRIGRE